MPKRVEHAYHVAGGIIVALHEGIAINRVSLDSAHLDSAFYHAVKADEGVLLEAIIRDLTVCFAGHDLARVPHLLLLAAMVQCSAELEAGSDFDRREFNRNMLSSCDRAAKELVAENWDIISKLAEKLLQQAVINADDLNVLLLGRKL